jgi:hypothetical protein
MADNWKLTLSDHLGKRYDLKVGTEKTAVMYRRAKTEFKATRLCILGIEKDVPQLELQVDIRIPKSHTQDEAESMLRVFEEKTSIPRGFERTEDETNAMHNQTGATSGWARSLLYLAEPKSPQEAANHIRALVENLDIPIILGIHDEDDLYAKDARPLPKKKPQDPRVPMEVWRFRLSSSLLYDLSVVIDPNERTLKVMERRGLSPKQVGETVKLAHISAFSVRNGNDGMSLIATKRDHSEVSLVQNAKGKEFISVAARMAAKVRIPISQA